MAYAVASETKTFKIDCYCSENALTVTWLNYLGGFDYWRFTANKDKNIEIRESAEVKKNFFKNWPQSYGTFADTIRKQTYRDSNYAYTVRSQNLTQAQVDALAFIKTSPLVQIINSRTDRRTVIVDTDSFRIYTDRDDIFTITFNISYTDDIPSQTA